jgi:hypothetical protein
LDLSRPSAEEEKDAEVMVAMTRPLSLFAACAALEAPFFGAEGEFWPDLLKEGFNCRDLAHMVSAP